MAAVTIRQLAGGQERAVLYGSILMPRRGAWQASLQVDGVAPLAGKVQIATEGMTLVGTVFRGATSQGVTRCRVIAGAGGLRKKASPKHYTSPTVRLVLAELAAAAGETVSPTADAGLLAGTLFAWTTLALETGAMLGALVELLGEDVGWRLVSDGSIWVGRESWPDSGITDYREIEESPEDGWVMVGVDVPRLLPGTQLGERKADVVEHFVSADVARTKVWLAS